MKKLKWILTAVFLSAAMYAYADAISVHWPSSTTNVDGTPIIDLGSFNVYARIDTNFVKGVDIIANVSEGVVPNPTPTGQEYSVSVDIPEGTWVTVTAVDTFGNESDFGQPVQFVSGAQLDVPNAPGQIYLTKP